MNPEWIDGLLPLLVAGSTRRRLLGRVSRALLIVLPLPLGRELASARHRHRHRKRHRRTSPPAVSCMPNCSDRTCGSDGCGGSCGSCETTQLCQGGSCCTPQAPAFSCAGRCGTVLDNCGQAVTCTTCPSGRVCLANGSCAISCESAPCPGFCGGCNDQNADAARICDAPGACSTQECTSTVECPPGMACVDCGFPTFRCGAICVAP